MRISVAILIGLLFPLCSQAATTAPFDLMDRNGDGSLSAAEFRGPAHVFKKLDANGDGKLSRGEAAGTKLLGEKKTESSVSPTGKKPLKYIDIHNHFMGTYRSRGKLSCDFKGPEGVALKTMDACGVKLNIIMPPPESIEKDDTYTADKLLAAVKSYPDRFAFMGGGGTLNIMIQKAVKEGRTTDRMRKKFEEIAELLIKKGAVGFGEMCADHLSFNAKHPYISMPADHPLYLLLADIAAKHDVPIDFHMEAVPESMSLPKGLKSPPNPGQVKANMPAFARLLAHNRKTRIVWDHLGWDCMGCRNPESTQQILKQHSNLYISIRIPTKLHVKDTPPTSQIVDESGKVKMVWLQVFEEFPDRFMIGSDEFFMTPKGKNPRHGSTGSMVNTTNFLDSLPGELAAKIGYRNAIKVFRLKLSKQE